MGPLYRFFGASDPHSLLINALLSKTKDAKIQFFRYIFVGGFSALVNLSVLYALTSLLHVHYLLSELIAFLIATIVNYILSIWWVFERSSKFKLEFVLFTLVGVGGLVINETVLWVCVSKLGLFYIIGEAIAIASVTVWSFALRKLLFDKLSKA